MVVWLVAAAAVGGVIYLDPLKTSSVPATPDAGVAAPVVPVQPEVRIDAGVVDAPNAVAPEVVDAAAAPPASSLYTVTEAFEDIAAGPLVFIGTGEWFGNFSIPGCAYRNSRVIVVYQYCTGKEQHALGLVVISPTRGHLNIYAEGESAISTSPRASWFTFRLESEPVIPAEPSSLDFTYADLRAWDERRYNTHAGACWSGEGEGCSTGLDAYLDAWSPSAKDFLAAPPEAFFKLAKDLHARAGRDSRRTK